MTVKLQVLIDSIYVLIIILNQFIIFQLLFKMLFIYFVLFFKRTHVQMFIKKNAWI